MNCKKYDLSINYVNFIKNVNLNNTKQIYNIDCFPNYDYTYNNKILETNNNYIIKFVCYEYINSFMKDMDSYTIFKDNKVYSELFLIKEYLEGKLCHTNFLDYNSIIYISSINCGARYSYNMSPLYNIAIVMKKYRTLTNYLQYDLDLKIFIRNMYNIVDLCIYIKNKYNIYHSDIKIDNILVKENIFYLIDWEYAYSINKKYYHIDRPDDGNTEMYPFYDATAEEFVIHSLGVLMVRILGFKDGVVYSDFTKNQPYEDILSKIQMNKLIIFEDILKDIFTRKIDKIEYLKCKLLDILIKI